VEKDSIIKVQVLRHLPFLKGGEISVKTKKYSWNYKKWRKYGPFFIMMVPGLLYFLINNYIPMFGTVLAFQDFKYNLGITGSRFVGLDNFKYLFSTGDAWKITRNTLAYNAAFIFVDIFCAVSVAIIINDIRNKTHKKIFQTLILLPYLISMVVVSYIVYGFLSTSSGFVNNTLLQALGKEKVYWYTEPKYWPFILVFVHVWKNIGYSCIIYLATLVGIDSGYYEAASIDGATKLQQIRYITLPFLKGTIITMFLLSVGKIFYSDFGLFYQVPMNSGALYDITSTIDTYVYRGLMQNYNVSMSAAAGLYQSLVGFILVVSVNKIVHKVSEENALF